MKPRVKVDQANESGIPPVRNVKRKRVPGALKGKLRLRPEFFVNLPADELKRWE